MNLTKKRWIILVASCLINLCIGSLYAWSVFATPMAEYLTMITGNKVKGHCNYFHNCKFCGTSHNDIRRCD